MRNTWIASICTLAFLFAVVSRLPAQTTISQAGLKRCSEFKVPPLIEVRGDASLPNEIPVEIPDPDETVILEESDSDCYCDLAAVRRRLGGQPLTACVPYGCFVSQSETAEPIDVTVKVCRTVKDNNDHVTGCSLVDEGVTGSAMGMPCQKTGNGTCGNGKIEMTLRDATECSLCLDKIPNTNIEHVTCTESKVEQRKESVAKEFSCEKLEGRPGFRLQDIGCSACDPLANGGSCLGECYVLQTDPDSDCGNTYSSQSTECKKKEDGGEIRTTIRPTTGAGHGGATPISNTGALNSTKTSAEKVRR